MWPWAATDFNSLYRMVYLIGTSTYILCGEWRHMEWDPRNWDNTTLPAPRGTTQPRARPANAGITSAASCGLTTSLPFTQSHTHDDASPPSSRAFVCARRELDLLWQCFVQTTRWHWGAFPAVEAELAAAALQLPDAASTAGFPHNAGRRRVE